MRFRFIIALAAALSARSRCADSSRRHLARAWRARPSPRALCGDRRDDLTDRGSDADTDFWQARIDTKGTSDVHILENGIAAGRNVRLALPPGARVSWSSRPAP